MPFVLCVAEKVSIGAGHYDLRQLFYDEPDFVFRVVGTKGETKGSQSMGMGKMDCL